MWESVFSYTVESRFSALTSKYFGFEARRALFFSLLRTLPMTGPWRPSRQTVSVPRRCWLCIWSPGGVSNSTRCALASSDKRLSSESRFRYIRYMSTFVGTNRFDIALQTTDGDFVVLNIYKTRIIGLCFKHFGNCMSAITATTNAILNHN